MAKSKTPSEIIQELSFDPFELLAISDDATKQDIVKAYRKLARIWHPDKQPEEKKKNAEAKFHQLSKALEILTDSGVREAFKKRRTAKREFEARKKLQDSKRQKLRVDLERREKASAQETDVERQHKTAMLFQAEFEKLQREGAALLEQEQKSDAYSYCEEVPEPLNEPATPFADLEPARLKISWKVRLEAENVYNQSKLRDLFSRYGDITALIVSSKKKGSAIVEFHSPYCALAAYEFEKGFSECPLVIKWIGEMPDLIAQDDNDDRRTTDSPKINSSSLPKMQFNSFPTAFEPSKSTSNVTGRDFENLVLMRLRREQERKELIDRLKAEDELS